MENLQLLLVGGNGIPTDICVYTCESSDSYVVMLGTALLERIGCDKKTLRYRMLIGRLVNTGWPLAELQRKFGHDPRTMKKWAGGLLTDDVDEVVRAFRGRGADRKVTAAIDRYVQRRYRKIRHLQRDYRKVIACEVLDYFEEDLSREVLRRIFREADEKDASAASEPPEPPDDQRSENGSTEDTCCQKGPVSGTDEATSDNPSPDPSDELDGRWQLPVTLAEAPSIPVGVHHLGLVLFLLPFTRFKWRRPHSEGLLMQWIGQILQGAVNIEQSRELTLADLGLITGPIHACMDRQRKELRLLAGQDAVLDIYAANARLLSDGPGRGGVFYYDPHSKECTTAKRMLKDWCGRRHGVTRVMHLDMIHTESGRPCFIQHYTPFYDLRERFFVSLELFNGLFSESQRRGRTFVLDRGIYGLDTLRRFGQVGDYIITWEKGYSGGDWADSQSETDFWGERARNSPCTLKRYHFQCREQTWSRDPSFRRILVRATNPRNRTVEVAIICNNPHMDVERIVWLMFNRWVQENSFKYLDRHFGLTQLTSYATSTFEERAADFHDRLVECPEYAELKKQQKKAENRLARLLLKREKKQDEHRTEHRKMVDLVEKWQKLEKEVRDFVSKADELPLLLFFSEKRSLQNRLTTTRKSFDKAKARREKAGQKAHELEQEINGLKESLKQMNSDLDQAVRERSRLQILIDGCYEMYDSRCKATLDALRITAANMFAELLESFRPLYGNYRNDHVTLRLLTRADGFLHREGDTVHTRLWLKGRFQPAHLSVFKRFLARTSAAINASLHPDSANLRISLLEKPPTW